MFFHFTGIKDISEKNYTLDLLIEAEDITVVKAFLASQKVVTLALENFEGNPESFGKSFFKIKYEETLLTFFSQFEDLKELLTYLFELRLEVQEANYIGTKQLSSEESQALLQSVKQEQLQLIAEQEAKRAKADSELGTTFFDKRLKKAQEAIEEIINQIDQVLEIGREKIAPNMRKKLDDTRGNIAKLRLATNYDNIVQELHSALDLIISAQDFLLERLEENKVFSILKGSEITNVDIIGEQTKLAKARLLQTLGASLDKDEAMYASLGYLKIFSQYLYRDINVALENKFIFVQQIFKGLEALSLFVMLELALLAIFGKHIGIELSLERFGIIFMYVAIFGLLIGAYNHFARPKSLIAYGRGFLGILALYVGIMYLLSIFLLF